MRENGQQRMPTAAISPQKSSYYKETHIRMSPLHAHPSVLPCQHILWVCTLPTHAKCTDPLQTHMSFVFSFITLLFPENSSQPVVRYSRNKGLFPYDIQSRDPQQSYIILLFYESLNGYNLIYSKNTQYCFSTKA